MKNVIIFIGERIGSENLTITGRPSFYDAIILSQHSPHSTMFSPYQSILLDDQSEVFIHCKDDNIHLSYHQNKLKFAPLTHQEITEEEVFSLMNSFVIKQGKKVTFLGVTPYSKFRTRKKRTRPVLVKRKKPDEKSKSTSEV